MVGTCRKLGDMRNAYTILDGRSEEKKLIGNSISRWEYNMVT
jgi:hypothetical protein